MPSALIYHRIVGTSCLLESCCGTTDTPAGSWFSLECKYMVSDCSTKWHLSECRNFPWALWPTSLWSPSAQAMVFLTITARLVDNPRVHSRYVNEKEEKAVPPFMSAYLTRVFLAQLVRYIYPPHPGSVGFMNRRTWHINSYPPLVPGHCTRLICITWHWICMRWEQ